MYLGLLTGTFNLSFVSAEEYLHWEIVGMLYLDVVYSVEGPSLHLIDKACLQQVVVYSVD